MFAASGLQDLNSIKEIEVGGGGGGGDVRCNLF